MPLALDRIEYQLGWSSFFAHGSVSLSSPVNYSFHLFYEIVVFGCAKSGSCIVGIHAE